MGKKRVTKKTAAKAAAETPAPAPAPRPRSFSTTGNERPEDLFSGTTVYIIRLVFLDVLLGTVPYLRDVYARFVATHAPEGTDISEELTTVPEPSDPILRREAEEKGWTGFHLLDGLPILYNYVIKGFMKEACGILRWVRATESKELTAYKKRINGLAFVYPRQLRLVLPNEAAIPRVECEPADAAVRALMAADDRRPIYINNRLILPTLERPLRAQTAQGERVTVVRSDICPAGTSVEFRLSVLDGINIEMLQEWFSLGVFSGLGQWRSGGHGTFRVEARIEGSDAPPVEIGTGTMEAPPEDGADEGAESAE